MKRFLTLFLAIATTATAAFAVEFDSYFGWGNTDSNQTSANISSKIEINTTVTSTPISTTLYYEGDTDEIDLSDYDASNPYLITLDDNAIATAGNTNHFVIKASGNQTTDTDFDIDVTATPFYTIRTTGGNIEEHDEQAVNVQFFDPATEDEITTPSTLTLAAGYRDKTPITDFNLSWADNPNPDAGDYQSDVTVSLTEN
ncbi:MAG: hypothetical protein LKE40_03565 [Spirochaetia bacterium]|jgi:hypothetical protein|nr:hypothetical protein [Spirochaetia bacterium]